MVGKVRSGGVIAFPKLSPKQVRLTSFFESGKEHLASDPINIPGIACECICDCICDCDCDCFCDCICECICDGASLFESSKLPIRVAYEVVYELKKGITEEMAYTGEIIKSQLLVEMDPEIADKTREGSNLRKVKELPDGTVQFAVKKVFRKADRRPKR